MVYSVARHQLRDENALSEVFSPRGRPWNADNHFNMLGRHQMIYIYLWSPSLYLGGMFRANSWSITNTQGNVYKRSSSHIPASKQIKHTISKHAADMGETSRRQRLHSHYCSTVLIAINGFELSHSGYRQTMDIKTFSSIFKCVSFRENC